MQSQCTQSEEIRNLQLPSGRRLEMSTKRSQVLILPFPIQGHINPMLHFSKLLASKSPELTITILLPPFVSSSIPSNSNIKVRTIPDGANQNDLISKDFIAYLRIFQRTVPQSLHELLLAFQEPGQDRPVVIIYDSILPWVLDVVRIHGLLGASFFTQTCSINAILYTFGEGKLFMGGNQSGDGEDQLVVAPIPGLPHQLQMQDLPSFIIDKIRGEHQPLLELLVSQFCNLERVDFVLYNAFDKLEDEMVQWMINKWKILTVGPAIPARYLGKPTGPESGQGEDPGLINVFQSSSTTDQSCQEWLDSKESNSVIYVAFGSLAVQNEEQMSQMARCLKNLGTHFLWVVRKSELTKLPPEFIAESGGLGLVVTWCNQLDVLAHKAVGCFVTHCGWNSTLEALCLGVPMVGMPYWSDQPTNAKFVEDVWRVGVWAKKDENGIVTCAELERCVRMVLEDEEIRRNAVKIKEWAVEAVRVGGRSDTNLDEFVAKILPGSHA